ncbi:GntR family transcriptional regulator [Candidimonas nitroreducens]|uniref:GntR family transcriptional regulator n=1 Tax=Candidimonas nitroreducens TaxID=683354 RepID=A0A225LYM4_9BURK|nr:GntR family transcriptional regulator [Candidimonas nitroreducens]OWT54255.1 GntR family transcriptional regulator [Candidimonas nitroreducens]
MKLKRSEQLRQAIEEKIAMGEYAPGRRLDEVELAAAFGVSRTPLREALIQLGSAGLLDVRPRRGAVVAEVDPRRLCEMFEVMAELEAMCGRLAARRITEPELAELRAAHAECGAAVQAHDLEAYYEANARFHAQIYHASHNLYLAEQALRLHRRLRVYRRLQLRVRDRIGNSYAEHGGVLEALAAGDSNLTAERLRQHVVVQGERFGDLIASLNSLRTATEPASG